jgi:hypothetical protein
MVPETSAIFNQLIQLIAREDFINVSRRESLRSYIRILYLGGGASNPAYLTLFKKRCQSCMLSLTKSPVRHPGPTWLNYNPVGNVK